MCQVSTFLSYIISNDNMINYITKIFNIFLVPQTAPATTTDVSVKEGNREETHPPKDVTIKQEEIQEILKDADLDDDKLWCDNIDGIIEMFKFYDY
ncbi:hypothetical protein Hanom_Chr01g00094091 [Helianthus anomalus]